MSNPEIEAMMLNRIRVAIRGKTSLTDISVAALKATSASDLLEALKAMADAPDEQPIGAWRYVINTAVARAMGG